MVELFQPLTDYLNHSHQYFSIPYSFRYIFNFKILQSLGFTSKKHVKSIIFFVIEHKKHHTLGNFKNIKLIIIASLIC